MIGNHQRVPLTVIGLLPKAVEAFGLHQPVHKIPVGLALATIGARRQWIRKHETEHPLRLRVLVEDVRDDLVGCFVLPIFLVAAKSQEMHPRRVGKLVGGQSAIRAETPDRMHVAVMRAIPAVRLLDPQGDRLGDQCLQLDIARGGNDIERPREIPPDS